MMAVVENGRTISVDQRAHLGGKSYLQELTDTLHSFSRIRNEPFIMNVVNLDTSFSKPLPLQLHSLVPQNCTVHHASTRKPRRFLAGSGNAAANPLQVPPDDDETSIRKNAREAHHRIVIVGGLRPPDCRSLPLVDRLQRGFQAWSGRGNNVGVDLMPLRSAIPEVPSRKPILFCLSPDKQWPKQRKIVLIH